MCLSVDLTFVSAYSCSIKWHLFPEFYHNRDRMCKYLRLHHSNNLLYIQQDE